MTADEQRVTNNEQRTPKALILTGFGINCEEEMAAAYRLAGGAPTIVHLNEVLHGRVSIHDFDVLNFPGGFSFGDDLGSGVVLANKLRYRQTSTDGRTLLDDIRAFVAAGKFVLGICNGFQVLVKLGLLPNLGGDFVPEVTLTHNASNRYENRWVRLKVNPQARTPFLRGLTTLEVPVRHGEGRLVVPDAATREQLVSQGLNCLSYADGDDRETGTYPLNPNGADLNCAGLCDPTGRIFGLMPHPEAFLAGCNHPDWGARGLAYEEGEGLAIFRNIVEWVTFGPDGAASPPGPLSGGEGEPDDLSDELVQEPITQYGSTSGSPSPPERGPGGEAAPSGPNATNLESRLTADKRQWHQKLKQYGRQMRKEPTPAENELWQAVRGQKLGVVFRRQHAIAGYIADFVTLADKLVIELDGGVHDEPEQAEYDYGRTQKLEELGYRVLRFRNEQVVNDLSTVLQIITSYL